MSKEDFDNIRMDMVREMRDMKQSMNDANRTSADVLQELKT